MRRDVQANQVTGLYQPLCPDLVRLSPMFVRAGIVVVLIHEPTVPIAGKNCVLSRFELPPLAPGLAPEGIDAKVNPCNPFRQPGFCQQLWRVAGAVELLLAAQPETFFAGSLHRQGHVCAYRNPPSDRPGLGNANLDPCLGTASVYQTAFRIPRGLAKLPL